MAGPRNVAGDGDLSDEERRLFEEAMRDVRRIEHERAPVVGGEAERPAPSAGRVGAASDLEAVAAGEHVSVFDTSVAPATRRALRRGAPPPEATLDLHGSRAADAERLVRRFVYEARAAGRRSVLLITGRGLRSGPAGAVLRDRAVSVLTRPPVSNLVLGLTSAPPALGGVGALLILLRRR